MDVRCCRRRQRLEVCSAKSNALIRPVHYDRLDVPVVVYAILVGALAEPNMESKGKEKESALKLSRTMSYGTLCFTFVVTTWKTFGGRNPQDWTGASKDATPKNHTLDVLKIVHASAHVDTRIDTIFVSSHAKPFITFNNKIPYPTM